MVGLEAQGLSKVVACFGEIALLREHMPEHPWPAFDDPELQEIVGDACAKKRSVEELRATGFSHILKQRLAYPLDRILATGCEKSPGALASDPITTRP